MVYTRITQPGQRREYSYKPGETLLFRLSGTVIPAVWHMSLLTCVVTFFACVIYEPLRQGSKDQALGQREKLLLNLFRDMEKVMQYFTGFVTFILGFFNSIVFNRWWHMRELIGNIVEAGQNTAMHIAVFFVKEPPARDGVDGDVQLQRSRRELIRLLALGQALALQACHRVRDHTWLINRGLLVRDSEEHMVLQNLASPGYNEVFCWYVAKAYKFMGEDGMVDEKVFSSVLYSQRWSMLSSSNHSEDLMMHLNQQIPVAYTHLLELMTKLYVLITPLALVPSLLWVAIPVAPLVTLFFYGFFRLGTTMLMDPFQKDSGFDTEALLMASILNMESLERNVPLSWVARRRRLEEQGVYQEKSLSAGFLADADAMVHMKTPPLKTPTVLARLMSSGMSGVASTGAGASASASAGARADTSVAGSETKEEGGADGREEGLRARRKPDLVCT